MSPEHSGKHSPAGTRRKERGGAEGGGGEQGRDNVVRGLEEMRGAMGGAKSFRGEGEFNSSTEGGREKTKVDHAMKREKGGSGNEKGKQKVEHEKKGRNGRLGL